MGRRIAKKHAKQVMPREKKVSQMARGEVAENAKSCTEEGRHSGERL